jgi:hypothetical protein
MRQARQLKNRQLFPSHSKSMLQAVMKRSQRNIYAVLKGKSVMDQKQIVSVSTSTPLTTQTTNNPQNKGRSTIISSPNTRLTKLSMISNKNKNEELFRNVARQVASFHMKLNQDRVAELEEKLDNIVSLDKKEEIDATIPSPKKQNLQSRSKSSTRSAFRNTYFQQFAALLLTEDAEDHNNHHLEVGEYLEGTSIYFGATIALQVSDIPWAY